MSMVRAAAIAAVAIGCGDPFPSPWQATQPAGAEISGWMKAQLDHEAPGPGWFRTEDLEAIDYGQAARREVRRAKDDVIVLQIGQVGPEERAVLEFDIALSAWVAGPVPVDGIASIGQLTLPSGETRLVLGGDLEVRQAGAVSGEPVEVAFDRLELVEAQP